MVAIKVSGSMNSARHSRLTWRAAYAFLLFLSSISCAYVVQSSDDWIYTVEQGDNPWSITEKYLNGIQYWKKLIDLNGIDHPETIPVGTRLRIPLSWIRFVHSEAIVLDSHGAGVVIRGDGSNSIPLISPTRIVAGDRVEIPDGGSALLLFADGSRMHLSELSNWTVERLENMGSSGKVNTQSTLEKGQSEIEVKTRGTRFEINTPSANTAVRGTAFRVRVDNLRDELSRVEVTEGAVGVTGSGQTRQIASGQGTRVETGARPEQPTTLLAAPSITHPGDYSREEPLTLEWRAVADAAGYRVKIRRASEHQTFIVDETTPVAAFSVGGLDDGDYVVQIRAIDALGLEGFNARSDLELDAQPQPPVTISPRQGEVIYATASAFEWSIPVNADRFAFQLARDPKFEEIVIEESSLTQPTFATPGLEPGRYFWRVTSKSGDETGPSGPRRNFLLKAPIEAPNVATSGNREELILDWGTDELAASYRLQTATDTDFTSLLIDETVTTPQWRMKRPAKPLYFRVRAINEDGYEGAWSVPQELSPAPVSWFYMLIPIALYLLAL
ncbi:MAG: LysM peptidoglycan-binding domain-containing protein [Proteobacteria bacterium]|nr:MAG: LysM peptidoglycan-binding domain-containing protein [Pseudomonadota bacterium]